MRHAPCPLRSYESMGLQHIPVMVEEVMTFLGCELWSYLCGCHPGRRWSCFRDFEADRTGWRWSLGWNGMKMPSLKQEMH